MRNHYIVWSVESISQAGKLNILAFDEAFSLFELDDKTGVVVRKFNIDKNRWADVYILSESIIAMSNGTSDEEWGIYSLADRIYLHEFRGKFPGRFAKKNGVVLYGNTLVMNRSGHPPGPSLFLIYDLQTGKISWKTFSKFMAIGEVFSE